MKTMQSTSRILFPLLASAALVFTSCSKEDELEAPATAQAYAKSSASETAALFSGKCFTITNFVDQGTNETNDYNNIVFEFGANNVLTATNPQGTASGSWNTSFNGNTGVARLIIQFQGVPGILLELNEDWRIVSSGNGSVNLQDQDGGFTNELQFTESDCDGNGGGGGTSNLSEFTNTLATGNWVASQFIINNVNRLNQLNNVTFTFSNGVLTLQRNNQSRAGSYSTLVDDGLLVVDITGFQNPPAGIQALNEDWKVISWTADQIELEDPFDNGNPKSFLTLVRP